MSTPKRIQCRRAKGWRAPEGAVYVGRGSKWGNPYRAIPLSGSLWTIDDAGDVRGFLLQRSDALKAVVGWYSEGIANGWDGIPSYDAIRTELRGKTLMCWCPEDQPCHADVLLEIANQGEPK